MTPNARHEDAAEAPVFEAEITPHRSLSRRGFAILMGAFAALTLIVSLPFFLIGAWPIAGFLGLDVLLLWLAFRASFAQARACERILLTHIELTVRKVTHRGAAREWRFNPNWVRLESETDEDFGMIRLAVRSRQDALDVGRELSPGEREEFATAFGAALARVKSGRRLGDD